VGNGNSTVTEDPKPMEKSQHLKKQEI